MWFETPWRYYYVTRSKPCPKCKHQLPRCGFRYHADSNQSIMTILQLKFVRNSIKIFRYLICPSDWLLKLTNHCRISHGGWQMHCRVMNTKTRNDSSSEDMSEWDVGIIGIFNCRISRFYSLQLIMIQRGHVIRRFFLIYTADTCPWSAIPTLKVWFFLYLRYGRSISTRKGKVVRVKALVFTGDVEFAFNVSCEDQWTLLPPMVNFNPGMDK